MATIPFSCHQRFIWCKVGDKLSFIKDYVSLVSTGQRTVVLVRDKATVRNVVTFLWGCNIPVLYHHSGHLGDQGRLAQVLDGYLTASKPVIVSQERHCTIPFICTAHRLVVVDFPKSVDSYRDCKTLINFNTQKGLVTTLVSETEDHLLPELKDYIFQKGEDLPPWLAQESVVSQGIVYSTVGVSSTRDNFPQDNWNALSSCPKRFHKPHWRKPPPKPPFISPNILDRPLVPDPYKSWNQVGISTRHTQSNSGTNRPSHNRVRREITYKYGLGDTHLKNDGHKYDALLSRHLLAIGARSPVEFPSSSGTKYQSQSCAISCPPSANTGRSLDQGTYSVTMQPKLSKVSTEVPNLLPPSQLVMQPPGGSLLSQSIGSPDQVPPKSNISQDPKPPISSRSKATVPPVATIVSIVDSNSSLYVDLDGEDRDSDVSDDFGDDDPFADSEDDIDDESLVGSDNVIIASSPDILTLSQCVLSSLNSQNTRNCPLIHNTPDSDDGTQDGSSAGLSTDDSEQEDFLQLGVSQSATSAQTKEVSFPLRPSKSNDSDMVNVGSLSGPRVLHTDTVKHSSSRLPVPEPVFAQSIKSSLVGKRIAAGLGFQQNTVGLSSSVAILPSKGGTHHTSQMSSPLANSENISDGYDSSVSLDCSHITGHVMSKSTRVTSEDVSSPFSLVNTDPSNSQLNYKGLVSLASDQPQ